MAPETHSRTFTILLDDTRPESDRVAELLPLVYEQLRAAAQKLLALESPAHTLQATALVHEAYLKLVGPRELPWRNRAHFYAAAAEAMRQVLLDHARARGRVKRGAGRRRQPLSVAGLAMESDFEEIVSLDDALCRLMDADAQIGQIVRLRFYSGLSIAETAKALGISPATVKRRWEFGRTWLFKQLSGTGSGARDGDGT